MNYAEFKTDWPTNIWTHPEHYGGFSPDGDIVICTQSRDSRADARSNYTRILQDLNELSESLPAPTDDGDHGQGGSWVYDFRASHWGCGWREYLLIRKDAPAELIAMADEILGALESYPVYDESHFSELEWNEAHEYWASISIRERVDYIKENGGNIFAARLDYISENADPTGSLFEQIAYN
jgi:hypothetical protein